MASLAGIIPMSNTKTDPKCADLVAEQAASTLETIRLMLCPEESDVKVELTDDGATLTLDGGCAAELRVADHDLDINDDGEGDTESLISDHFDYLLEQAYERFHGYGLCFDYVDGDAEHFFRYQLSWGGPSTEIRFFANYDLSLYRIEFWYLDWFDGACVNITSDETAQLVWDQFNDTGHAEHAREKALEA